MKQRNDKGQFIDGFFEKGTKRPDMVGNNYSCGKIPWNKGTKGIMKAWNKGIKTGLTPKNIFKKGTPAWNKGMKQPQTAGKNNTNWKGGITTENDKIRHSLEYKLWRKACFERDNFTCQVSGKSGGELVVHHINNFAEFPELRTTISNGITMSKELHKLFHNIYGRKNNTKEQLIEFNKINDW